MAKFMAVKDQTGALRPVDEQGEEYLKTAKIGDHFMIEAKFKRNGKHHKLGMMLLRAVFNNQDRYQGFEAFLNEVKILTGHVTTHVSASGQVYYVTKSISFESMCEAEFRTWKNDALNSVLEHFIPDMPQADRDRLEHYILTVG